MVTYLLGRVLNNKWLFTCLLIGAIIACAVSSSIPLYTNAILQRVLTKDLENYQVTKSVHPGLCDYSYTFFSDKASNTGTFQQINGILRDELIPAYNLPLDSYVVYVKCNGKWFRRPGYTREEDKGSYAGFVSLTDFEDNIELIRGRIPEPGYTDGTVEVLISERAMKELKLILDEEYNVWEYNALNNEEKHLLKARVVGVFKMKPGSDLYWSRGKYANLDKNVLVSWESLKEIVDGIEGMKLEKASWTCYFDYYAIKIQDTESILQTHGEQQRWVKKNGLQIYSPLEQVLKGYGVRRSQLSITLWFLTIPLMMIVAMYTFMITGLIVRNDSNEISVLKSRGAGTLQIFATYIIESVIVALFGVIAGPFAATSICRVIGASNGFLQFVNRAALNLEMNMGTFMYSAAAGAAFIICMLIPAFNASRISIVQYKRSKISSALKKPIWQRLYLDIIVLAVAVYGYDRYKTHQNILGITGFSGEELSVDPLLYFISTLFILGVCLLFLRLYPLLIRAMFKLGEKYWNPVSYFSLINVGRADKNLQFIMVFVVLALSFGIINANQARAINKNIEDKVRYQVGADVIIEPYNNLKHTDMLMPSIEAESGGMTSEVTYIEPPYEEGYKKMEGVEHITKVVANNNGVLLSGNIRVTGMRVLGIIPHEFGKIAWFRDDLLPHHINEYLNMMTAAPKAVLLSSNIRNKNDIRVGDEIRLRWGDGYDLTFVVYGFIDYFPTCNPYGEAGSEVEKYFAVMNYSYLEKKLPAQPYEIWIKKKPGVEDSFISREIVDRQLKVERVDYLGQEIIKKKNDPMLQGTNGVLTMCFIITMLIATTGFVIFWTLSIKERALKFGIFRAIGMRMGDVTLIMILEQILVSGCSAAMGIFLGTTAGKIFIPLLQLVYSTAQQVPPFIVAVAWGDYVKVLVITGAMLITALSILYAMVRHIRVNQVIKLGED